MDRIIDYYLYEWRLSQRRKPMILRGARQVGKTNAVRRFSSLFDNFVEINFELSPEAKLVFNKNLQPEKSVNYELGVQSLSNNKKNSLRIVAFKRDIKQLIIFYSDPVTYASQYLNRDTQKDYGFELESSTVLGKIGNWVNNFTYVDGAGETDNVKVKNLYRRPNFTFNSTLTVQPIKQLTFIPSFRFVGTRLKGVYDAGPATMPQYYTLDLYGGYNFNKQCRFFVDWRNLTDQKYSDIIGYNSRGANVTIGLSANF